MLWDVRSRNILVRSGGKSNILEREILIRKIGNFEENICWLSLSSFMRWVIEIDLTLPSLSPSEKTQISDATECRKISYSEGVHKAEKLILGRFLSESEWEEVLTNEPKVWLITKRIRRTVALIESFELLKRNVLQELRCSLIVTAGFSQAFVKIIST
jgi:hypothetical protein